MHQRSPYAFLLLPLLLFLPGCASASGAGGEAGGDLNTLTRAELEASGVSSAYEAIERLRPRWLRVSMERSYNRETDIAVFLDRSQLDGVESLRNVQVVEIVRIRWLDSAQAGLLPGLGSRHVEGAIVVETR